MLREICGRNPRRRAYPIPPTIPARAGGTERAAFSLGRIVEAARYSAPRGRPALKLFLRDAHIVPKTAASPDNDGGPAMLIRNVMTEHVMTVRPDASIFDVARLMRDADIGAVPVAEDDRLVGMVTDRDIVVRA